MYPMVKKVDLPEQLTKTENEKAPTFYLLVKMQVTRSLNKLDFWRISQKNFNVYCRNRLICLFVSVTPIHFSNVVLQL
jgi:hypothetical protein